MVRRSFLRRIAIGSAAGLAPAGFMEGAKTTTVTWRVKGFTCPACAVGLEVMLRERTGVARATASYPQAIATIEFDPAAVSEACLKSFIMEMGFRVEERG